MTNRDESIPLGAPDSTASYEAMDIGSAIERLTDFGFHPDQIALVLDKPVGVVRTIITRRPAPEDRELADEVRRLCLTAIRKAHFLLDYGTGDQKMRIILACISGSSKMLALAAAQSTDDVRTDFLRLMNGLRDVPARETVMTEEGAIDVASSATPS